MAASLGPVVASPSDARKQQARPVFRAVVGLSLAFGFACAPMRPHAPPAQGPARVSGALVAIENEASRLELTDRGHRFSVFYNPETIVRSGSGSLQVSDIRLGDRLVISVDENSQARLMSLAGPRRLPKEPNKTAEEQPSP